MKSDINSNSSGLTAKKPGLKVKSVFSINDIGSIYA